jgi:rubredoxin
MKTHDMKYACLGCGLVQDRLISKRRYDIEGHGVFQCIPPTSPFHGYIIEWKCKKCGHTHYIGEELDGV